MNVIFVSPSGGPEDLYAFLAGCCTYVAKGNKACFLTSPNFKDLVDNLMNDYSSFQKQLDLEDLTLSAPAPQCKYVKQQAGQAPDFTLGELEIRTFTIKRLAFNHGDQGNLRFFFPDVLPKDNETGRLDSCTESDYCELNMFQVLIKKNEYGDFLSNWHGAIKAIFEYETEKEHVIVTNSYERADILEKWNNAMGLTPDIEVRMSSMALADEERYQDAKFYALSRHTAPTSIYGGHKVPVPRTKLQGPLLPDAELFAPKKSLPQDLKAFLEEKATIVVTVNSLDQANLLPATPPLLPLHVRFLVLGSSEKSTEDQMHYPASLGVQHLAQAFALAGGIIHGCALGTIGQVLDSGKPSIGIIRTVEQECNAKKMYEKMPGAPCCGHFKLQHLLASEDDSGKRDRMLSEFVQTIWQMKKYMETARQLRKCQQQMANETSSCEALANKIWTHIHGQASKRQRTRP